MWFSILQFALSFNSASCLKKPFFKNQKWWSHFSWWKIVLGKRIWKMLWQFRSTEKFTESNLWRIFLSLKKIKDRCSFICFLILSSACRALRWDCLPSWNYLWRIRLLRKAELDTMFLFGSELMSPGIAQLLIFFGERRIFCNLHPQTS